MTLFDYCVSVHSLHPHSPTTFLLGGGVEPPTKFSKREGLAGPQLLEGGCWEREGDFREGLQFSHKKLKSEIFIF